MTPAPLEELPLPVALRIDEVCRRFESAWRGAESAAEGPSPGDYLESVDSPVRNALLRELLLIDVHHRRRLGDSPRLEDYHPLVPNLAPTWLATLVGEGPSDLALGVESRASMADTTRAGEPTESFPRIPGYQILEVVGRGGMGVVYRARHIKLNRTVAIKMILAGELARPKELERFRREAEAAAQLQHPGIAQIHEIGEFAGHPYLTLEYLDGGNLHERLAGAPQPPHDAARLVAALAEAMHHAHARGIVHRDLKPANVLLHRIAAATQEDETREGRGEPGAFRLAEHIAKVGDFGLAKLLDANAAGPTRSVDVLGTPSYMAPEQASRDHAAIGPTTDVYGLGTILYELLTGRPPFLTESALETLVLVRAADPVPPSRLQPRCPRDLETICLKCLRKEQAKRYPTALALAEDLRRFLEGRPTWARPVSPWEQTRRWVTRNPVVASLLTAMVLLALTSFGLITAYALRAERRRGQAERAEAEARAASEMARNTLYFQQIGRAYLEWQSSNQEKAEELLRLTAGQEPVGWEWEHVRGLCESDLLTLAGHGDQVSSVLYAPDGRWIVSATGTWYSARPGEIRVWDARSGALLRKFAGNTGAIHGLAIHPDGRRAATAQVYWSGTAGEGIRLWDLTTGEQLPPPPDSGGNYFAVAFSPDGRYLAAAGGNGKVRLWDLESKRAPTWISDHGARTAVYCLAFSPDGRHLASGSWDGGLILWSVEESRAIQTARKVRDIRRVAFTSDGKHLITTGYDMRVAVWDARTLELLATHSIHNSAVLGLARDPAGTLFASGDTAGRILVHDPLEPRAPRALRGHTGSVLALAFSPDGTRLASAGGDGNVKVWDPRVDQEFELFTSSDAPATTSVAFSPDGSRVAAAGAFSSHHMQNTSRARVWDAATGRLLFALTGHAAGVTDVEWSPDGARLVTSSLDRSLRFWNAKTGRPDGAPLPAHQKAVLGVAHDRTGNIVASVGGDGMIRLWDARSRQLVREWRSHAGAVTGLAFSPTRALLATFGDDHVARLWDPATGKELGMLAGHEAAVNALAFSPDGAWLATGGDDRRVIVWDVATRREILQRSEHTRAVMSLVFSPDGNRLVSGSRDWSAKLWDVRAGSEAFTLRGYRGEVLALAFQPGTRRLLTGGKEGTNLKLWNTFLDREERIRRADARAIAEHGRLATDAERQGRWDLAEFHLGWLRVARPADEGVLLRRARARVQEGRWDDATEDLVAATAISDDGFVYYQRAALMLRRGDVSGYRALCREAIDRLGAGASEVAANNLAWLAVMRPDSGVDPQQAVELARRGVEGPKPPAGHLNTLGLALYRAGRVADAIDALTRARAARGRNSDLEDSVFLALCHDQLGHRAEADYWYARFRKQLESVPPFGTSSARHHWSDQLTWPMIAEEARATLRRGD